MQVPMYTIQTWSLTILENVNSMVWKSAAPKYSQKLTYLCWNHKESIRNVDNLLPSDMTLQKRKHKALGNLCNHFLQKRLFLSFSNVVWYIELCAMSINKNSQIEESMFGNFKFLRTRIKCIKGKLRMFIKSYVSHVLFSLWAIDIPPIIQTCI